ncbi:hypothetical protein CLI98_02121 [Bacillus velezensis]|nr:hypothetical protein NG74_00227 [Bacillus velezensis]ATD75378.1 hypothetical protein CLI98_02121 [Bacillus velezensis]
MYDFCRVKQDYGVYKGEWKRVRLYAILLSKNNIE